MNQNRPFASAVLDYAQAGWPCVMPVGRQPGEKSPPLDGFTGADGRDTTPMDLVGWAETHAYHAIALRMPDDVIGIDVDHYTKGTKVKRGADTLAEYEAKWGPLPATWSSTARGDANGPGLSRIMFFRVPRGRYATKLGDSIEIIQRHHRYAVVAPSTNPDAGGAQYHWYDPQLALSGSVPKPDEFPYLPAPWVAGLREGATEASPAAADVTSGQTLLAQLLADSRPPCADVTSATQTAHSALTKADAGCRHDTATARVHHLIQLGAAGHPGIGTTLAELAILWEQLTAGEDRGGEWARMLLTSARKAVTVVGTRQVDRDPCLLAGGVSFAAPAPADNRPDGNGDELAPAQEPRWWSVRELIGTHAFDPRADLDQTLAHAVLERTYPVMRYAHDAGTWLLRGPDCWDTRGDLAAWAVAELADLMPTGDPEAEASTDERRRADRRKRLMTSAGANGVAVKMRALVASGFHPCSLKLADLDADPEVFWAGGVAWDLRASIDEPTPAPIHPGTPHQHSALVAPDLSCPTPLWDAFTATVWPDPEVRAWALRVLSIALTGYPDAALPILHGLTRRGKSAVVVLLMSILGSYAHAADPRLLASSDNNHASIIYALKGRRLSFIDEGPRDGRWAQERLKQLTGSAPLTGNRMRENPVTFAPTHTLVLTTNDEPNLTDPAIVARVRLIPCNGDLDAVRRARAAIGPIHGPRWRAEAPGVLAQMICEAARWLEDPDSATTAAAPASIRGQADEIAQEQDLVRPWVEGETVPDETGTKSRELFKAFVRSARDANIHSSRIPSEKKWGLRLNELGYPVKHRNDGNYRLLKVRGGAGWEPLLPQGPVKAVGDTRSTSVTSAQQNVPEYECSRHATEGSGTEVPKSDTGVKGPPGSWRVGEGLEPEPFTDQIPRSNPVLSSEVKGVKGSLSTSTTTSIKGIQEKISGVIGGSASTLHSDPIKTGSDLRMKGPEQPFTAPANPSLAAPTPKGSRTARKAAVKAAAHAARVAEAAGEQVQLPALVDRSGAVVQSGMSPAETGAALARVIERTGALTVDVETTGYPVGHADYALRTIQLGDAHEAVVLDAADPAQAEVARAAPAAAPRLHAHSATADLVPLAHAGLIDIESAWERMHDTVIPALLADPQSTGSDASGLKELARDVLGEHATAPGADEARKELFKVGKWLTNTKVDTPVDRSGWAQVDSACATMVHYAASDVLDTAALAERLPTPPPTVLERERIAQRMTARVAHRGLRIDGDHVNRLLAEHTAARATAANQVRALGVDSPGSDQQIGARLLELGADLPLTKTGKPSVAADVLKGLKGNAGTVGELVQAVLTYRHHDTAIGTFLEPYRQLVTRGDGRARPTVYTLGTDTGRMSCVRPNLQQVPRQGGVRACITADPGQVLISADFASVEIRVMAALSQDPHLMQLLADGLDVHDTIARQVFGPEKTHADRYVVKRGVFGWAYGGGIPTLAKQVGTSEAVMASVVDVLASIAPQYVEWSRQIKAAVKAGRTQFPTYSGRTIHLQQPYPHKAPNFCVQGTARELLIDALVRWRDTRWGNATLLPVHDELVVAVPAEDAEEATSALVAAMRSELYGVAIAADPSPPSFAWADST